ncbi:MAG: RNA 2'-phosphotransferase, partial [Okeania sp. SIO2D1]|nr:RNA 2'-phosphotransferase [Okeania sp. SIO2D1]
MKNSRLVKISKYLSYHLRHHPEKLGLELTVGGWVEVEQLLRACQKNQFTILPNELEEVVANNDKQRFAFDQGKTLIRANQGHSVNVDLQLEPVCPPDILYHGTGHQALKSICQQGLKKMARHHVHLSKDLTSAQKVGKRRGRAVIFEVN